MNYWITTDTHFGHDKLINYCERPEGFEKLILKRLTAVLKPADILIHLGDFCIGNDLDWHLRFEEISSCRKWLIRGNHDKKTASWYLRNGWDFIANYIGIQMFGKKILLSHIPQEDNGFDINLHGHFHNSDHRRHEPELKAIQTEKHKVVMLEHHYQPQLLRRLAE